MRLGIRGKLFAISLALISSVGLACGIYLESELRERLEKRAEVELLHQALVAVESVQLAPRDPTGQEVDQLADRLGAAVDSRITIVAPDGRVLGDSEIPSAALAALENHGERPEIVAARTDGRGQSRRHSATLETDLLYVAVPYRHGEHTGVVRVARPLADVDQAVARLRMLLLLVGALGLAVAVLMSGLASHLMSRTLRRLALKARSIASASGEAKPAVGSTPDDELGRLSSSLDRVAGRIESTVKELATERSRFEAVLQGMQEAVVALDGEQSISIMNAAALSLFQLDKTPLGQPFIDYVRIPSIHDLLRDPSARARGEFELPGPPRRQLLAQVSRQPLGESTIIVMYDVTDVRRLETVRRDFVANVSHELRTPVSVVRANAETLLDGAMSDPVHGQKLLGALHRNAERLASILEELLDLSRLEAGRYPFVRGEVSAAELAQRTVEVLSETAQLKDIELSCAIPEVPKVHTDAQALERILVNFLDNAIKYTPSGGAVRISAQLLPDYLRLEVVDNGPGIAGHHRDRVFERFYRVDPGRSRSMGGTGLGLSIVKHLCDALDCRVGVDPVEPHGSCFWVELPLG